MTLSTMKLEDIPKWSEVEDFLGKIRVLYRKRELSLRNFLILSIYPTTGMKTSEMLSLTKVDFNLQNGTFHVRNRNSFREVVLMPSIIPFIKEQVKDLRDQDRIFKITRRQALNINYKYSHDILGRQLRIEDWRHAFAIRMLETIKDHSLIKKLLGQKSSKMIKIYQQAIQRDFKDEVIKAIGG